MDRRTTTDDLSAPQDLTRLSLSEVSELLRRRKVSPVELTQQCLRQIDKLNGRLNAFITVTAESALKEARTAEEEIGRGNWRSVLHGVPIALKDIIEIAGVRITAASALRKDCISERDAEIVCRLKAAGAVFVGKTNLHEFAYGGSSAVSYFGPVRNPWNSAFCSGGSSGGSAVAVSTGMCYAAIGTDTGGSIRQPASYCGVVGLKPTYGRVSCSGVIPLSWTLDHVGPLTRTAKDAALVLEIIAGYDPQDNASHDTSVPVGVATIADSTSSLRLGIPRAYFYDELHPEVQSAMEGALGVLKNLTKSQRDTAPLATDATYSSWTDFYGPIFGAEAYAYHQDTIEKTPELYQPATLKRLRAGGEISAASYIRSRRELERVRRAIISAFDEVDFLITPTVRIPPFMLADLEGAPDTIRPKELAMLHNTRVFNYLGLPTISVSCGFTRDGLPIGMQITGRPNDEATVCRLAYAYEQATEWHQRAPKLS